jgi:GNAT superfamily N-acetyltransferase
VGLQVGAGLLPADAEVGGAQDDDRHAVTTSVTSSPATVSTVCGRWAAAPRTTTRRSRRSRGDKRGIALGAFASGRLVGIGVVVPHLRPKLAQLAFLHVSAPLRATGVGSRLSERLEQIARTAGASDMVVSATPSENTVRFYLGRRFQPMATPLAELFELEPDDVHMSKVL